MSPVRRRSGERASAGQPGAKRRRAVADHSAPRLGPDVAALEKFLRSIGIDPRRDPEYTETAELAAQLFAQRAAGLREEIRLLRTARYQGRDGESVTVDEIPVYGLCPHHLIPFFGEARVTYVPRERVSGPGSMARLVRDLGLVPRIQENLTQAIADHVEQALRPHSLEVVVRARHLCVEMRGVERKVQFVTEARRTARR